MNLPYANGIVTTLMNNIANDFFVCVNEMMLCMTW
jgi:hypothetical protein